MKMVKKWYRVNSQAAVVFVLWIAPASWLSSSLLLVASFSIFPSRRQLQRPGSPPGSGNKITSDFNNNNNNKYSLFISSPPPATLMNKTGGKLMMPLARKEEPEKARGIIKRLLDRVFYPKHNKRRLPRLQAQPLDNVDTEEEDDENKDEGSSRRMRDRIREWFRPSSSSGDGNNPSTPTPPVKARFDSLFSGMPGINDILSSGADNVQDQEQKDTPSSSGRSSSSSEADPSWFEAERSSITANYENILKEVLLSLEQQRREDPKSVPENAEVLIKSVLKQEMDAEIKETKDKRYLERLASYEKEQRAQVEAKDVSGPATDSSVRLLIDDGEAEYERQFAAQKQLNEFLRYEAEAVSKGSKKEAAQNIQQPEPNDNLDQWALERLQDMARNQEELDADDVVLNILEANIQDLQKRIAKESAKDLKPETMKEWQMYCAIAARLGATVEPGGAVVARMNAAGQPQGASVTAEDVFRRLQSWKEYNQKEMIVRKQAGLSRGPKLPFEWQELRDEWPAQQQQQPVSQKTEREMRRETRKQINRMSINALESLLVTCDAARRENLEKEIAYLKQELESKDYLDFEEPAEEGEQYQPGPVDLSDVFTKDRGSETPPAPVVQTAKPQAASPVVGAAATAASLSASSGGIAAGAFQADAPPRPPPPPITPFFLDDTDMEVAPTDSKLGTMEDQKLEAMYRKAGARTKEERERIKAGYEEFKRVEEEKRKIVQEGGLTDPAFDNKYNVSEIVLEGGDLNASKILAAIGPRPTRTKKKPAGDGDPSLQSIVDKKDVVSSMYRSLSGAVGGRFKDDPEAKARDLAKFAEYLKLEEEMRAKIDQMPENQLMNFTDTEPLDLNDEKYVEQVFAKLGPRPTRKTYERIGELNRSDTDGVHKDDDDQHDDDEEEEKQDQDEIVGEGRNIVPEWVKREQQPRSASRRLFFRGEDIEESISDDKYERNMRQLAEYERRRAGQARQMGFDISDILGPRRDIRTNDNQDYKYDDDINQGFRRGWGGATFETRKRDLLEYTELDVSLLNALMEQRAAVSETGVSRYMAKINKPFKEFGAILRVEGVIADVSGLQMNAWTEVAEVFGVRQPTMAEVKMASVIRPDLAIRDVFVWTNDVEKVSKITAKFREKFDEVFDAWAKDNGLPQQPQSSNTQSLPEKGSLAIGEEVVSSQKSSSPSSSLTEAEMLEMLTRSWSKTADKFNFPRPGQDKVLAAVSMGPELAILELFRWTADGRAAVDIASYQLRTLAALKNGDSSSDGQTATGSSQGAHEQEKGRGMDENQLMELHYRAWTSVASAFGYARPTSDEVLAAFVLKDPVFVVKRGFGWTKDAEEAQKIGRAFTDKLRSLADDKDGAVYGGMDPPSQRTSEASTSSETSAPLFNDIAKFHRDSWSVCCHVHKLKPPTPEQLRMSVSIEPRDFIRRIMEWSDDETVIEKIAQTFRNNMQDVSASFLKASGLSVPQGPAATKTNQTLSDPSSDEIFGAVQDAWKAVARKFRKPQPTPEQILYAMTVGSEEAIRNGFRWSSDDANVAELLNSYMKEIEVIKKKWASSTLVPVEPAPTKSVPLVVVNPGSVKWIKSLLDVEMECGVISHLTRSQVSIILEYAGIADLVGADKRVPASMGAGARPTVKHYADSQQMLAAALRLERRPDHCVVIDASPGASTAAKSVEMRSVAWIGPYPRYELLAADVTVSRLDELTAMNIRRLFGERVYDEPELEQLPPLRSNTKKTKTRYDWGDDETEDWPRG